jgi:branched-chain amino acid transport system ATP-binding protein
MLLVEQNITMALKVSDYAYVMETGEIRTEGEPDEIMKEERILEAYLGE